MYRKAKGSGLIKEVNTVYTTGSKESKVKESESRSNEPMLHAERILRSYNIRLRRQSRTRSISQVRS